MSVKQTLTSLTKKQLAFVKNMAKGESQMSAAKNAGYCASSDVALAVAANRMLKQDKILDAIDALRGEMKEGIEKQDAKVVTDIVKEIVVDRNMLTVMAVETYNDAKADRNHAVRIQAINALAKMHGLIDDGGKGDRFTNINANIKLVVLDEEPPKTIDATVN